MSQTLSRGNYSTWSRSITISLNAKNTFEFLDGSIQRPDKHDAEYAAWTRCNDMIPSWILDVVSKEIAASIIYVQTAEEIWKELREHFSQGNGHSGA